jgi:hypothetical protein
MVAPSPTSGASLFKLFAQDLEDSGTPGTLIGVLCNCQTTMCKLNFQRLPFHDKVNSYHLS